MIFGCQGVSPLCFLNSIALFISRSRRISNDISVDYMCKKHLEGQIGPRHEIGKKKCFCEVNSTANFCQMTLHFGNFPHSVNISKDVENCLNFLVKIHIQLFLMQTSSNVMKHISHKVRRSYLAISECFDAPKIFYC